MLAREVVGLRDAVDARGDLGVGRLEVQALAVALDQDHVDGAREQLLLHHGELGASLDGIVRQLRLEVPRLRIDLRAEDDDVVDDRRDAVERHGRARETRSRFFRAGDSAERASEARDGNEDDHRASHDPHAQCCFFSMRSRRFWTSEYIVSNFSCMFEICISALRFTSYSMSPRTLSRATWRF